MDKPTGQKIEDLTPEQRELLMATFAQITENVAAAITSVVEAMKPIIEAYNKLPAELKAEIGMRQVTDKLGEAITPPAETHKHSDYIHGVDCDKKGVINVYHFSDCASGEKCELFQYMNTEGNAEKHLKRGWGYTVTRDRLGAFIFSDGKKEY